MYSSPTVRIWSRPQNHEKNLNWAGTAMLKKVINIGTFLIWTLSLESLTNLTLCQYAEKSLGQDVPGFILFK